MKELETIAFYESVKKLILSQYKEKPNMAALFKVVSSIFEDIQDINFLLRDLFWLSDAVGEQLEFIGLVWDVSRNGLDDVDYRQAIYDKIGLTLSGTILEIKKYVFTAFAATFAVYSPEYPAGYRLRTDATISSTRLNEISPSGVQAFLAGKILDGYGNHLVDARGNHIIHISTQEFMSGTESGGSLFGESLFGSGLYGGS